MSRNRYLDPKARRKLIDRIKDQGEITMDEAVEIVAPHIDYDLGAMKEQLAKRVTRGIIASIKDQAGVRTCFATKQEDRKTLYVDIDTCRNLDEVRIVEGQLRMKVDGILKSHKKAVRRQQELEGQMMMAEMEGVK